VAMFCNSTDCTDLINGFCPDMKTLQTPKAGSLKGDLGTAREVSRQSSFKEVKTVWSSVADQILNELKTKDAKPEARRARREGEIRCLIQ